MSDPFQSSIRTYRDSFHGIGCGTGCLIHLALMTIIGLTLLVWIVLERPWEWEVTVKLPSERSQAGEVERTETSPAPPP